MEDGMNDQSEDTMMDDEETTWRDQADGFGDDWGSSDSETSDERE